MLYTKTQLAEWKKKKVVFYLSKPIWKTTHTKEWKKKSTPLKESNNTRWKHKNSNATLGVISSKKYVLYFDDTNRKAGMVTLEEVNLLTKSGIKVLAEKDGFAC